jgi:hypothetical protein
MHCASIPEEPNNLLLALNFPPTNTATGPTQGPHSPSSESGGGGQSLPAINNINLSAKNACISALLK